MNPKRCMTCRVVKPASEFVSRLAKRCNSCRAVAPTGRECTTCGNHRLYTEFPTRTNRSCAACHEAAAAATCRFCGEWPGMVSGGGCRARVVCAKPACQAKREAATLEEMYAARDARIVEIRQATSRKCAVCDIEKPLTSEHFRRGNTSRGGLAVFDYWCRPCHAAYEADRRRWKRGKLAAPPRIESRGTRRDSGSFSRLPAAPLHEALMRLVTGTLADDPVMQVCARAGIDDRQLRAWAPGGSHQEVQFDIADRILTRLGLLWFDVWEPGTPEGAVAAAAFEGESAVAA